MNTRISFLFGGLLVLASTEGQASEKQPGFTECTGRTQAIQEVQLRARVSGYLEKVLFEPGTEVKRDQILFQIDPLFNLVDERTKACPRSGRPWNQ